MYCPDISRPRRVPFVFSLLTSDGLRCIYVYMYTCVYLLVSTYLSYQQEYLQLLVVANTLVVGMVALVLALLAGIFLLETEWDESTSYFWSTYGG